MDTKSIGKSKTVRIQKKRRYSDILSKRCCPPAFQCGYILLYKYTFDAFIYFRFPLPDLIIETMMPKTIMTEIISPATRAIMLKL